MKWMFILALLAVGACASPPIYVMPADGPSCGCEWNDGTYLSDASSQALWIGEFAVPLEVRNTPEWQALRVADTTGTIEFLSVSHAEITADVDAMGKDNEVYERICSSTP